VLAHVGVVSVQWPSLFPYIFYIIKNPKVTLGSSKRISKMRIGELAKHTKLTVETIRFYEKEGLLTTPSRTESGYRCYHSTHLGQLQFIQHCRSLGMSLQEIRELQICQQHPQSACLEINALIDRHIAAVHAQLISLQLLEKQLQLLRERCQQNQQVAECGIMQTLVEAAGTGDCVCHPELSMPLQPR
jgi:Cd(II)/Pb(II)-responsive transcriptional regulator